MFIFAEGFKRICDIMVRKAEKRDLQAIVALLHQVDMVHPSCDTPRFIQTLHHQV